MKFIYSFYFCLIIYCLLPLSTQGQGGGGGIKLGWEFENDLKLNESIKFGDSIVLMNIKPKHEGHLGLWVNGTYRVFLFQIELLTYQTQERYLLNFLNKPSQVVRDKRLFLELPILLGVDYGDINFYGGIAPRASMNKPTNLKEWFTLEREQSPFNLKYILGTGIKIGNFILDFRYHNSVLTYVDMITLNGIPLQTVDHIERFSISVSINLSKD